MTSAHLLGQTCIITRLGLVPQTATALHRGFDNAEIRGLRERLRS